MKFKPRKGIFANHNNTLTFDPNTHEGRSYSWYAITRKYGQSVVLNTYRYSATTAKHVHDLRSHFRAQSIDVVEFDAPAGLQRLSAARELYLYRIATLEEAIAKRGTRRSKNEERKAEIKALRKTLCVIARTQLAEQKRGI